MVAFCQILVLGSVAGWTISVFQQYGLSRRMAWVISLLFACWPVNGFMVVTLWKDIPYGISLLALTILVLHIVLTNGGWMLSTRNWITLGLVTFCVAIFRHNGFLPAFATIFILFFLYGNVRRKILSALILSVMLLVLVKGPIYQLLDVQRGNPISFTFNKLSNAISQYLDTDSSPVGSSAVGAISNIKLDGKEYKRSKYDGLRDGVKERLASGSPLWRILPLENFFRREARANIWRKIRDGEYSIKYINSNKIFSVENLSFS